MLGKKPRTTTTAKRRSPRKAARSRGAELAQLLSSTAATHRAARAQGGGRGVPGVRSHESAPTLVDL